MKLNRVLILREQQLQNAAFWKVYFPSSDIQKCPMFFGTGQSTNSMARIMKANQMSKVRASSHEYPHVEKNQESLWTGFQRYSGPADCHGKRINLRAKRKTSGEKEKRCGKNKKTRGKKNNLTAKEKRIKNALSASKKFCREPFFLLEINSFAVTVVGHCTKARKTTSN